MSRMLIVDGMSVLKTTAGGAAYLTNGFAYNFFTQLTATLRKFPDVTGAIVCWEGGHEHRAKVYSDYKKDRKGSSPEIREQREIVQNLLELVGVDQIHAPGHEGDDVGAWLVHNLGIACLLYSNDKDWLQLVRPGISLYQKSPYSEGKKNLRVEITAEKFEFYTGYANPEIFLRAKCLIGDGSDGIPGIFGVGEATVRSYFLGLELSEARREKIEKFINSPDHSRNKMLMDLMTPKLLEPVWRKGVANEEKTKEFIYEIGWPSISAKFPAWWEVYKRIQL